MNIHEMDKTQISQLIRSRASILDTLIKCDHSDTGQGEELYTTLESLLQEWGKRGYEAGADKLWALKISDKYRQWLSGTEKIIIKPEEEKPESNDLFSVIKNRRSVRFWKKKAVPREKIEKILETGNYAPSAFHRLAWKFFVVENDLDSIVEGDGSNQSMFEKAPVRIYIAIDERLHEEELAPGIEAGLAIQNMLLAGEALGLGICLIYQCEIIDQEKLKNYLGAESYYRIYGALLLGYPDEMPVTPERPDIGEISVFIKGKPGLESFLL